MATMIKLLYGMARRLVKIKKHANGLASKLVAIEEDNVELEELCAALRKEISRNEQKTQGLNGEIEILKSQIVSLTMVIKRDQERVAAETAMYMLAAQGGEPVKHVGARVATHVTPGL